MKRIDDFLRNKGYKTSFKGFRILREVLNHSDEKFYNTSMQDLLLEYARAKNIDMRRVERNIRYITRKVGKGSTKEVIYDLRLELEEIYNA